MSVEADSSDIQLENNISIDDCDVSDRLVIVTDQEDESEDKTMRKRKRSESTNSSDDDNLKLPDNCAKVEEKLSAIAAKNNLTSENVKKILKRVVLNEHVLAIVRLREEEVGKNKNVLEPKLTRSKTKKLKNTTSDVSWPLPITPVKLSESVTPISSPKLNVEVESDDENNENSEDQTDDEKDATESDIDNQLKISITPENLSINNTDVLSPIKYSDDGIFKIPKNVVNIDNVPTSPILDDTHMDIIWRDFINEFSQPFLNNNEEDDEADPEYNVTADAVDEEEELSEGPDIEVSKEELKDLCAELIVGLEGIDFDIEDIPLIGPNSCIVPSFTSADEIHLDNTSPIKLLNIGKSEPICDNVSNYDIETNKPYTDNQLNIYDIPVDKSVTVYIPKTDLNSFGNGLVVPNTNGTEISAQYNYGDEHNHTNNVQENNSNIKANHDECNDDAPDFHESPKYDNILKSSEITVNNQKGKQRYRVTLPVNYDEWVFKEGDAQLLPTQREILDQQMRQHVQLATQFFIQVYGHPRLWKYGPKQLEYLMTLKHLSGDKPNSAFRACNLIPAIELCESWKEKLSEDTEETREMMRFIEEENRKVLKRRKQRAVHYSKFHNLIKKEILSTTGVFLYPELLPTIPFRVDKAEVISYLVSEDQLIAMGLEEFYDYINMNEKIRSEKGLRLQYGRVAELIHKYMLPRVSIEKMKVHIAIMKNHKELNPINYYYKYFKAPKTLQKIYRFDPDKPLIEHELGSFPITWAVMISQNTSKKMVYRRSSADVWALSRQGIQRSLLPAYSLEHSDSEEEPELIREAPEKNGRTFYPRQVKAFRDTVGPPKTFSTTNSTIIPVFTLANSQLNNTSQPNTNSQPNTHSQPNTNNQQNAQTLVYSIVTSPATYDIFPRVKNLMKLVESLCEKVDLTGFVTSDLYTEYVRPENQTLITKYFSKINNTANSVTESSVIENSVTENYVTENNVTVNSVSENNVIGYSVSENSVIGYSVIENSITENSITENSVTENSVTENSVTENIVPVKIVQSVRLQYLFRINKDGCSKEIAALLLDRNVEFLTVSQVDIQLKRSIAQIYAMLPSMPFLSADSKNSGDVSDDSNEVTETTQNKNQQKNPNKKTCEDKQPTTTKQKVADRKKRLELEANKAMFLNQNPYADELKETLYAAAYLDKVEMRLCAQNDGSYFKFHNILRTFDAETETPPSLYRKLEEVFRNDNLDLLEEFLTFLTPGQASEVGRFMDHFMLTCMSDFVERLQIFFANKPAQLKKVLYNLEKLAEKHDQDISMNVVKSRILPLLKGNQYLIHWFQKIFDEEKPPDSIVNSGYEVLDCDKVSKDGVDRQLDTGGLDYEVLDIPQEEENYGNDTCTCSCHESTNEKFKNKTRHCLACGMKYIQGRVFVQHGRTLRGVHLNWQGDTSANGQIDQVRRLSAPASSRELGTRKTVRAVSIDPQTTSTKKDSDDERVSPKRAAKVLRTPTSKGKSSKSVSCNKNLNKPVDSSEAISAKPSCSKSIIKDDDVNKSNKLLSNDPKCPVPIAQLEGKSNTLTENEDYFETFDNFEAIRTKTIKEDLSAVVNKNDNKNIERMDVTESQNPTDGDTKRADSTCPKIKSEFSTIKKDPCKEPCKDQTPVTVKTEANEDDLNWTRDEDKIILLILRNENSHEQTLTKIKELLPHRSMSEIHSRFLSVITLLQRIAAAP